MSAADDLVEVVEGAMLNDGLVHLATQESADEYDRTMDVGVVRMRCGGPTPANNANWRYHAWGEVTCLACKTA